LDAGTVKVFIEADAPRVRCAEHGVVVAHVPWARHGAGHTLAFDQSVTWLVTQCSKTAVTQLMRIAWRTVGAVIARVWADVEALGDRLDGLTRIGIDEISYKRGHRYLTVVVDHDSGRLLWAAPGRDRACGCRHTAHATRPPSEAPSRDFPQVDLSPGSDVVLRDLHERTARFRANGDRGCANRCWAQAGEVLGRARLPRLIIR
jgi:transposase